MYSFSEETVIDGAIGAVWQVATDIAGWPSWDPREEKARFQGEFKPGAKGWSKPAGAPAGTFTISVVEPERMWAAEAGIPFGCLRGENRYEPLDDRRIRVSKRVEVHGPFGPLFRLILGEEDARRHAQELRCARGGSEAA
jgi:hypothetical protein